MNEEQQRLVKSALLDADHLAECAERLLAALNRKAVAIERVEVADMGDIGAPARAALELEKAEELCSDCWRAVRSAAYEYRTREERARVALSPNAGDNPPQPRRDCGSEEDRNLRSS